MSPVGVMTAATMKMIRIAYLKCCEQEPRRDQLILARKNTTVGIWKTMPMPISIFV